MPLFDYATNVDQYDDLIDLVGKEVGSRSMSNDSIVLLTNEMIAHVESMIAALLNAAHQEDPRSVEPNARYDMTRLLQYESSTALLVGPEPASPALTPLSARSLKKRIREHVKKIAALTKMPVDFYAHLINTGDVRDRAHSAVTVWETGCFYHLPLIFALNRLNAIEIGLRQIELQAVMLKSERRPSSNASVHARVIECSVRT